MRKNIIAISLIVSFLMVVIHEMIPHHHHEMDDDIELFSHQTHTTSKEGSNSETDHTNHFPFPAHHHVSASEDIDIIRTSTSLEQNVLFSCCFLISSYVLCIPDSKLPENTFYSVITIPLSSLPFIISPNAMRGSPSIA